MRSKFLGYVIALTVSSAVSSLALAQPKNHAKTSASSAGGDKTIEKQLEWEKKVMGDDSAKAADMRKIAAAQKLADEAAKNPPPVQAPKPKDPNKEGVRAKQEAAIGLPIASDQETRTVKKSGNSKKAAAPSSSANDELGALVATSLAEEKSTDTTARSGQRGKTTSGRKGRSSAKGSAPSSLDQMFATSK
jgi:hypothetical protein